jgi:hypothetical protein
MAADPGAYEAAWWAVHDALPAYWRVGRPSFDPGRHLWSVTAIARHPGRGKIPTTVSGLAEDELGALRDLVAHLTAYPRPADDAAKRAALERRARLPFTSERVASEVVG